HSSPGCGPGEATFVKRSGPLRVLAGARRLPRGRGAAPAPVCGGGGGGGGGGGAPPAAGMSREGYTRRFRKTHGVPPHAFGLQERLNEARLLLRAGEPIAAVAADTGFTDQSHLGRCFRRAFGVTPGRYRAG
ncbi:helix-turn-helix domain-containing protein, partial [Azospirillum formosense]|nr:helix-turn-helix domain-containing protein [Azospirillum formosense]